MSESIQYTILYAEDEPVLRENMSEYLQTMFANVYTAKDGQEAYKLYKSVKPDIILSDIKMPYLDGLEFARQVRSENRRTRIILLSAFSETPLFLKAVELNLTRFLIKPVERKMLKEALFKAQGELNEYIGTEEDAPAHPIISFDDSFTWDLTAQRLYKGESPIHLTKKEYRLFSFLVTMLNQICSAELIYYAVWDDAEEKEVTAPVKNLIAQLRRKFTSDTLQNIYGEGYVLNGKRR